MLGKRQSGRDALSCLKACRLPEDSDLLHTARVTAVDIIAQYGMRPESWPVDLLAALKDRSLPDLDVAPERALACDERTADLAPNG